MSIRNVTEATVYDETEDNCCTCPNHECTESCICYHTKTVCKHRGECIWKHTRLCDESMFEVCWQSDDLGYGLRTTVPLPGGKYILEYVGENLFSEDDVLEFLKEPPPIYMMDAVTHWIYANEKVGNKSRYINHSCTPNLAIEHWADGEVNRIFFKTLEAMPAKHWLSFSYNTLNSRCIGEWVRIPCKCRPECPNFI
jgi:[histone H3]-lysine4 N-trimethyltransferase ASH1L